jgi:pimeloyl-ACP methyl ester carboxylesterase
MHAPQRRELNLVLYSSGECRRCDASRWTLVQGVFRPRQRVAAGEPDSIVSPGDADRAAAHVSGITVTRLFDRGNLAHEEQPARVAQLIEEFCKQAEQADNDRD